MYCESTGHTNVLCTSGGGLRISAVHAHVVVLPPHQPPILINGTSNFAQEYQSFRAGLRIFPDVSLNLAQQLTATADSPPVPSAEVSECTVGVYPPLNPDHETLLLPDNLIRDLGLTSSVTRQGTSVTGPSTVQRYMNVLRQLHYANRKPAYYLNRAFKLTCSQTSGRASSNEYLQTVTVIHPQLNMEHNSGEQPHATMLEDDTLDRFGHQATLADVVADVDVGADNISEDALLLPDDLRK
ncbi:hypothetical protein FHG87_024622 [Trinorchestia longiramus]|nr:hypothetical protein FHG87_024622 [Trinorchestia longiramus]